MYTNSSTPLGSRSSARLNLAQSSDPTSARRESSRRNRARRRQAWTTFEFAAEEPVADDGSRLTSPVTDSEYQGYHLVSSSQHRDERSLDVFPTPVPSRSFAGRTNAAHNYQQTIGDSKNRTGDHADGTASSKESVRGPIDLAGLHKNTLEVFGNALPAQDFINGNPGTTDGQVQFVQHSNGKIAAYQWKSLNYQWSQIGEYCHARSTFSGQIAHDTVILPSTWNENDLEPMARFHLLAKQREARATGADFADKQIKALLPSFKPALLTMRHDALPITDQSSSLYAQNTSGKPGTDVSAGTPIMDNSTVQHGLISRPLHNIATPADHDMFSPTLYTPCDRDLWYQNASYASAHQMQSPCDPYTLHRLYQQHLSMMPSSQYAAYSSLTPHNQQYNSQRMTYANPAETQFARATSDSQLAEAAMSRTFGEGPSSARSLMRSTVLRMSEQAIERSKSSADLQTLLNGAGSPSNANQGSHPSLVRPPNIGTAPQPAATVSRHLLTAAALQGSSPDTGVASRPLQTFRTFSSSIIPSLTRQDFAGPFFPADNDAKHDLQAATAIGSRDVRINEWWWSGNNFARQSDFYDRLKATSTSYGSIGSPSGMAGSPADKEGLLEPTESTKRTYDLGRLIVPLLENMTAYINGPAGHKRDHFSPWSSAPEWTIDKTLMGNNSFFETADWNPPARIGRDNRYQLEHRGCPILLVGSQSRDTLVRRRLVFGSQI